MVGKEGQMKRRIIAIFAALLTLTAACSLTLDTTDTPATNAPQNLDFEAFMLRESSVYVIDSGIQALNTGDLANLTALDDLSLPAPGTVATFELGSDLIRESDPPGIDVRRFELFENPRGFITITLQSAGRILHHIQQDIHFIDVRTAAEYEDGHVGGSLNLPLDELEKRIEEEIPDKNDIVILYCRSGSRSAQAASLLSKMGYSVLLDAGGILSYGGQITQGSDIGSLPEPDDF